MTQSREWNYDGKNGNLVARTWSGDAAPDHVVLLAHGYGEHIGRYERVADALVASGGVVYAVDHVGHGKSNGERVVITDYDDVVSDFHILDETARREYPGLPVVLVGHSMGGLVAARYAQRYAETLTSVALSGPLIGPSPIGDLLTMEEIPDAPLDVTTLSRDPAVGTAYEADPLIWHGPFKRPTLEAIDRAIVAVHAGPALDTLPLIWMHGEDDQLVPLEGSRQGIEHLRGPRFEQRIYPGARHEIFNEINSNEVLSDLIRFLGDCLSQAGAPAGRPVA